MKKYLLLPVFILIVAGFFITQVYAMNHQMDCSHEDYENFGQHISMMAPEHPQMHGAMFGNTVGDIAKMHSTQSNHMGMY